MFSIPWNIQKVRKKKINKNCLVLITVTVVEDLSNSHYELGASIPQTQHKCVTKVENIKYTLQT